MKAPHFKHIDFIRVYTSRGLTYTQAERAYSATIEALEKALTSQQTIRLGHLGKIQPKIMPPRPVTMGCMRKKGGAIDGKTYKYSIGRRVKFNFILHEAFAQHSGFK